MKLVGLTLAAALMLAISPYLATAKFAFNNKLFL